jgi:Tfp pilus assembly protein PilO
MAVVAVAACAGLTLGAYAIGVRPLLEQRERETLQHDLLQDRRATASQLGATVSDLQRELADAKTALERTTLRLQPATLVNQRLEAVAQLANDAGVALDEMRPGAAVDSTHYQTVPIRIVGSGRYPACTTFLRKLRGTFGDMGIRSFQTGSSGSTPAQPTALFQAELVWYTELPRK